MGRGWGKNECLQLRLRILNFTKKSIQITLNACLDEDVQLWSSQEIITISTVSSQIRAPTTLSQAIDGLV